MKVVLSKPSRCLGFTLEEVVMALALSTTSLAALISGYAMTAKRAEWVVYSAAAQSMANSRNEFTRAARWDPAANLDEVVSSNFPIKIEALSVPVSEKQSINATSTTTITLISTNPLLKMIKTECVWTALSKTVNTNTAITYRSPDQ